MKEFDELLAVANRLIGPGGCPWDHEQTFLTLQPYLIEECHEVVEAVDDGDDQKIFEELGDLLYTIIFYSKIAEREKRFTIEDILITIKEKLIRRHPHVFGEEEMKTAKEVLKRWEEIKKEEASHTMRTSAIDGVPERLPLLSKAQKVLKKSLRAHYPFKDEAPLTTEKETGEALLQIILRAEKGKVDVESALRRTLSEFETDFRSWEDKK